MYNRFLHPLTDGIQRNLLERPPSPHHEGGHTGADPEFKKGGFLQYFLSTQSAGKNFTQRAAPKFL